VSEVIWHDVECGAYTADMALWLELARREDGPILDVGAGTGRVAIPLNWAGHEVHALDIDAELLAELSRREPGIATHVADAQSFALDERFGLIIAPMQTAQLLDDVEAFLAAARGHLRPNGLIAVALATDLQPFEDADLVPDGLEREGWTYLSTPVALREGDGYVEIERVREAVGPGGRVRREHTTRLARLAAEDLGPYEEIRDIPETEEHVASEVVLIRG
jgi:SAM-dependent methyltransferase